MRTVGYIPEEGAEQKVTKLGGTPATPEPPANETGTPVPPEPPADASSTTPPKPKADPVKKGGKKE